MQETWSRLTSTLAESVGGIRVTQAFVRQEINSGFFRKLVNLHGENNVGVARASAVFIPLLQMKSQLFLGATACSAATARCTGTAGCTWRRATWSCSFSWPTSSSTPSRSSATGITRRSRPWPAAERFFRLINLQPEWEDAPSARPLPPSGAGSNSRRSASLTNRAGPCSRTSVSWLSRDRPSPSSATPAAAKPPSSPCCRSSTCPARGRVLLDGRDLLEVTGNSLHAQMGTVQQNNFLFAGSISDNIRFAPPGGQRPRRAGNLRALDCLDLLEELPRGLDTQVGEKSAALSLGQRQLICFRPGAAGRPAHRGPG